MRVTKRNLFENLEKLNLKPEQLAGILKQYERHRTASMSYDQGCKFKEINDGLKTRGCDISYHTRDVKTWGVYRINFGEKFYIGRSKDVYTRIKKHKKEILNFFATGEYVQDHYLTKVFEYLKSDVMAYYFDAVVLEKCYTVEELQAKEQKYLDKFKDNPNCLNYSFVAQKPINEIDETPEEYTERKSKTVVSKRGGRFVFYTKKEVVTDRRVESMAKSTPAKKQMATDFSFNVPELESTLGHTVYKLYYGDRYIVNKGKSLAGSLFLLQKGCGYFLAYKHDKLSKFDLDYWHKFYDFIRRNPGKEFRVEVALTSEDPYEILVKEQELLNENMRYKKMLNNNLTGYIPTLNQKTNMHNWITPEQVERFYKFLAAL